MPKAFVSSTYEDLKDHRKAVVTALRKAGFSVDPMEDWTSAADEPKKLSTDRMGGCHLCVLLVAFRRGHIPKGEELSITQMEYRYAVDHGIDVLTFLLDEDALWKARFDDRRDDPEIGEWRAELIEHRSVGFFNHQPSSIEIAPALSRWERGRRSPGDDEPVFSAELIDLRRLVTVKAALLNDDPVEATSISSENFRRIKNHSEALLWDQTRRDWWVACKERKIQRIADLKTSLASSGDPEKALQTLVELSDLDLSQQNLSALLQQRSDLAEVFEEEPAGIPEQRRNVVLVAAAESCAKFLPNRVLKDFEPSVPLIGALLCALDSGPLRDEEPAVVDQARQVRQSIVQLLRALKPDRPQLAEDDWALIPGGTFQMGSEEDTSGRERPVHCVELSSFHLLKHQVTNAEFAALFGGQWENEAVSKPNHPAVNVNWCQAYVFSAWLGGRLPTEAEWEYAARSGGKHRQYPWGDQTERICERAVVRDCGHPGPLPVRSLPKGNTDQGVSDMAGNVWEWVADWYRKYPSETQKDPWGPIPSCGLRVCRGGSFFFPAERARVTYRFCVGPKVWDLDSGFRVVLPDTRQPST